jgi:aryl-alcohol dehydrogenase-like predicted oxidoreductase
LKQTIIEDVCHDFPKNVQLLNQLTTLSKKKDCKFGQLTLAWILAEDEDFVPIPESNIEKKMFELFKLN